MRAHSWSEIVQILWCQHDWRRFPYAPTPSTLFKPLMQKVYSVGVSCKQYKGGKSPCDSVNWQYCGTKSFPNRMAWRTMCQRIDTVSLHWHLVRQDMDLIRKSCSFKLKNGVSVLTRRHKMVKFMIQTNISIKNRQFYSFCPTLQTHWTVGTYINNDFLVIGTKILGF